MKRSLSAAALATAFAFSACAEAPQPTPDPQVLEQFVARLEEQDRSARAEAVAEARRAEQKRMDAAEKRLDRYRNSADRLLSAPTTAEGAVRVLAGG